MQCAKVVAQLHVLPENEGNITAISSCSNVVFIGTSNGYVQRYEISSNNDSELIYTTLTHRAWLFQQDRKHTQKAAIQKLINAPLMAESEIIASLKRNGGKGYVDEITQCCDKIGGGGSFSMDNIITNYSQVDMNDSGKTPSILLQQQNSFFSPCLLFALCNRNLYVLDAATITILKLVISSVNTFTVSISDVLPPSHMSQGLPIFTYKLTCALYNRKEMVVLQYKSTANVYISQMGSDIPRILDKGSNNNNSSRLQTLERTHSQLMGTSFSSRTSDSMISVLHNTLSLTCDKDSIVDGATIIQEHLLPEPIQNIIELNGIVCAGLKREYSMLSLATGAAKSVLSLCNGGSNYIPSGQGRDGESGSHLAVLGGTDVYLRLGEAVFVVSMRQMPAPGQAVKKTIRFNFEPRALVPCHPFLFAFCSNACFVYSSYDDEVVEELPLPECDFVSHVVHCDTIFCASKRRLWLIKTFSLEEQIEQLVRRYSINDAFHLLQSRPSSSSIIFNPVVTPYGVMQNNNNNNNNINKMERTGVNEEYSSPLLCSSQAGLGETVVYVNNNNGTSQEFPISINTDDGIIKTHINSDQERKSLEATLKSACCSEISYNQISSQVMTDKIELSIDSNNNNGKKHDENERLNESFNNKNNAKYLSSVNRRKMATFRQIEVNLHVASGFASLYHNSPSDAMRHFMVYVDIREILLHIPELIPRRRWLVWKSGNGKITPVTNNNNINNNNTISNSPSFISSATLFGNIFLHESPALGASPSDEDLYWNGYRPRHPHNQLLLLYNRYTCHLTECEKGDRWGPRDAVLTSIITARHHKKSNQSLTEQQDRQIYTTTNNSCSPNNEESMIDKNEINDKYEYKNEEKYNDLYISTSDNHPPPQEVSAVILQAWASEYYHTGTSTADPTRRTYDTYIFPNATIIPPPTVSSYSFISPSSGDASTNKGLTLTLQEYLMLSEDKLKRELISCLRSRLLTSGPFQRRAIEYALLVLYLQCGDRRSLALLVRHAEFLTVADCWEVLSAGGAGDDVLMELMMTNGNDLRTYGMDHIRPYERNNNNSTVQPATPEWRLLLMLFKRQMGQNMPQTHNEMYKALFRQTLSLASKQPTSEEISIIRQYSVEHGITSMSQDNNMQSESDKQLKGCFTISDLVDHRSKALVRGKEWGIIMEEYIMACIELYRIREIISLQERGIETIINTNTKSNYSIPLKAIANKLFSLPVNHHRSTSFDISNDIDTKEGHMKDNITTQMYMRSLIVVERNSAHELFYAVETGDYEYVTEVIIRMRKVGHYKAVSSWLDNNGEHCVDVLGTERALKRNKERENNINNNTNYHSSLETGEKRNDVATDASSADDLIKSTLISGSLYFLVDDDGNNAFHLLFAILIQSLDMWNDVDKQVKREEASRQEHDITTSHTNITNTSKGPHIDKSKGVKSNAEKFREIHEKREEENNENNGQYSKGLLSNSLARSRYSSRHAYIPILSTDSILALLTVLLNNACCEAGQVALSPSPFGTTSNNIREATTNNNNHSVLQENPSKHHPNKSHDTSGTKTDKKEPNKSTHSQSARPSTTDEDNSSKLLTLQYQRSLQCALESPSSLVLLFTENDAGVTPMDMINAASLLPMAAVVKSARAQLGLDSNVGTEESNDLSSDVQHNYARDIVISTILAQLRIMNVPV